MADKNYIVMKEIQARSITQAIKKESKGVVFQVYENVDQTEVQKDVGFKDKKKQ